MIKVNFTYTKSTKGTHVFTETGDKAQHKIGTLYIKKTALETAPESITVEISAV